MSIKMMHTADPHLDTDHHSKINPKTKIDVAVESNIACLSYLVSRAVEEEVDIFVLPGDLYTHGKPSPEHEMLLMECLLPLKQAKIPLELDVGNHEKLFIPAGHRVVSHVIGAMLGDLVNVVDETGLKHYGFMDILTIPYPSKSKILNVLGKTRVNPTEGDALIVEYVLREIEQAMNDRDESVPLVFSGHFTVDGIGLPGSERDIANLMNEVVFPLKELEAFQPDYIALGHIHTPQALSDITYYAGSPNKLTFTDANDIKGGNLVTIGDKLTVEKVATPVRGMYKVDLSTEEFEIQMRPNDVIQVSLPEGETEIPKKLRKEADLAGASLIPKIKPIHKPVIKRTVLPETISPLTALETYLKEQGHPEDRQKHLINKAKSLGLKGDIAK